MQRTRKAFETFELRALAESARKPLPWPQSRRESMFLALHYAADLLDAADKVVKESMYNHKESRCPPLSTTAQTDA